MKFTIAKKCVICNSEFKTRSGRRKTCRTECASKYDDQKKGITVKEWEAKRVNERLAASNAEGSN